MSEKNVAPNRPDNQPAGGMHKKEAGRGARAPTRPRKTDGEEDGACRAPIFCMNTLQNRDYVV